MYEVYILRRAQKELSKIPKEDFHQVCKQIRELAKNPRPNNSLKLSAREGWRIRIGKYRVIYEINDKKETITVLHAGHRKDIYKGL